MKKYILVLFLFISKLNAGLGSDISVVAIKLQEKIVLDGMLNESVYQNIPISNFTQRDPIEGGIPSEKTEVWISYDDYNIYVSAKMYDSNPNEIDASLFRRDTHLDSDWFGFYVDPYLDKKTGYGFGVNAGGSLIDIVLFNDGWEDDSWDGIWEAKTHIGDFGWSTEIRIPFSQLRFNESEEMKWGINIMREIKRKSESMYFVLVPRNESGFISHFAQLTGLKGIKSSNRLELLPYFVSNAKYLIHDENDPFYKRNQYNANFGADLKIGLGTNLNLDATINPDFGQVEVDPAVLNLSAFETYFDEKRPFFVEGYNIFRFGQTGTNSNWGFNFGYPTLFYSRRIGRTPQGSTDDYNYIDFPGETRILGAAKITGKLSETLSIGAVSALTERTFAEIAPLEGSYYKQQVEPLTHYGVIKLQKEFNEGNHGFGIISTAVNRDLSEDNLKSVLAEQAYVFGLEGWYTIDKDGEYAIKGALAGSYITGTKEYLTNFQEEPFRYLQRPDRRNSLIDTSLTSVGGYYTRFMLNKQKGNWYLNTSIGAASPTFAHNDLGFQFFADKMNSHLTLGYRWYETDGLFKRKSINISHARSFNYDWNQTSNFYLLSSSFRFENDYAIDFSLGFSSNEYSDKATRGGPLVLSSPDYWYELNVETNSKSNWYSNIGYSFGKSEIGGKYFQVAYYITYSPTSQLKLSINPRYMQDVTITQWVDNIEDVYAVNTFGTRYLFAEIQQDVISADFRINWNFTPEISLQLFFQPFIAVGKYSLFKELSLPGTSDFHTFDYVTYDLQNEEYTIDPDGSGSAESFTISNPDFNYKSFRGNVVLRWETMPGSVLYLVWTHDKSNFDNPGNFEFNRDFKNMFSAQPNNIFLVKYSHWFDAANLL